MEAQDVKIQEVVIKPNLEPVSQIQIEKFLQLLTRIAQRVETKQKLAS